MDDVELRSSLLQKELFELFRLQLKKDFEVSGCDVDFIEHLPVKFEHLREDISKQLKKMGKHSASKLPELLYRIDVNEQQIKHFAEAHPGESWEELVAELIIKRILQKVILKKTYNKK